MHTTCVYVKRDIDIHTHTYTHIHTQTGILHAIALLMEDVRLSADERIAVAQKKQTASGGGHLTDEL